MSKKSSTRNSRGSSEVLTAPIEAYKKNKPTLTRRELEVSIQVGLGRTCPEAGQEIGISTETVRSHLASIRNKTGLRRKPQLMLWANLNAAWIHKQLKKVNST